MTFKGQTVQTCLGLLSSSMNSVLLMELTGQEMSPCRGKPERMTRTEMHAQLGSCLSCGIGEQSSVDRRHNQCKCLACFHAVFRSSFVFCCHCLSMLDVLRRRIQVSHMFEDSTTHFSCQLRVSGTLGWSWGSLGTPPHQVTHHPVFRS